MAEPHVITALSKKRSELSGQIDDLEKTLGQARADLIHIDATLRVFGYEPNPDDIPSKQVRHPQLFERGELVRFVLEQLRVAPHGLLIADLVERIVSHKGWNPDDHRLAARLKRLVGRLLARQYRRGNVESGEFQGQSRIWRIKGNNSKP